MARGGVGPSNVAQIPRPLVRRKFFDLCDDSAPDQWHDDGDSDGETGTLPII